MDERFTSLAVRLAERLDALTDEGVERIRGDAPEWTSVSPELGALLPVGTRASIAAELAAMADGARVPDELPPVDAEAARLAARSGFPLGLHLGLYRIGHAVQWEAWSELVEREVGEAGARRELLARGSRFFFAYADRVSRLAAEEHERERDRLLRGHEQRRVQLVRELLDGSDVDATALDYPLEAHHLALVASGAEAPGALRAVASALDRRLLLVELLQATWWAWLGGRTALASRPGDALARLAPSDGVQLAAGDDHPNLAGFRRSHREALQAHELALRLGRPLESFDGVALEAVATRSAEDARAFVQRELRGIDGPDERSARLRETLECWCAHGQNAAATAAALGLHEQTVAKRLRAIEQRIGRPVPSRRAELETALRLRRCLEAPLAG